MKRLTPRTTPATNIAFLAIMAGIDALLSLVSALLPASALFLLFFIPFTSALVAYYCQARYYPIYLFGALGVCIAVSAWDFQNTLFYVLPGLFTGDVYGFCLKKNWPSSWSVFLSSLTQFAFFALSLWLVKLFYEVDVRVTLLSMLGKEWSEEVGIIFPLFALSYSFGAVSLAHLFFSLQAKYLNLHFPEPPQVDWPSFLASILSIALSFLFFFLLPAWGYFFLGLGFYWALVLFVRRCWNPRWPLFAFLAGFLFLSVLLFALFYQKMPAGTGLGLTNLFSLSFAASSFLDSVLGKKKKLA